MANSPNRKSSLAAYLRQNVGLATLLSDPEIQQYLSNILTAELVFERCQEHNKNNHHHNYHQSRRQQYHIKNSNKFPNPINQPLSPLEQKLLEGKDSKEQQTLRVLLKILLEDD